MGIHPVKNYKSLHSMPDFTDEQLEIISLDPTDGQVIIINASPGSGKTTVSVEIAKRMQTKQKRVIYTSLNKVLVEQARPLFEQHKSVAKTCNAMCKEIFDDLFQKKSSICDKMLLTYDQNQNVMKPFLLSDECCIPSTAIKKYPKTITELDILTCKQSYIEMCQGKRDPAHDEYVKYVLQNPESAFILKKRYDVIIFDEAQDMHKPFVTFLLNMCTAIGLIVYVIGDTLQSCYGFKNCIDSMKFATLALETGLPTLCCLHQKCTCKKSCGCKSTMNECGCIDQKYCRNDACPNRFARKITGYQKHLSNSFRFSDSIAARFTMHLKNTHGCFLPIGHKPIRGKGKYETTIHPVFEKEWLERTSVFFEGLDQKESSVDQECNTNSIPKDSGSKRRKRKNSDAIFQWSFKNINGSDSSPDKPLVLKDQTNEEIIEIQFAPIVPNMKPKKKRRFVDTLENIEKLETKLVPPKSTPKKEPVPDPLLGLSIHYKETADYIHALCKYHHNDWKKRNTGEPKPRISVICRKNITVFLLACEAAKNQSKIYFKGGTDSDGDFIKIKKEILGLKANGFERHELQKMIEEAKKNDHFIMVQTLTMIQRLSFHELEQRFILLEQYIYPMQDADFMIGTVHMNKGLEFEHVFVVNDFKGGAELMHAMHTTNAFYKEPTEFLGIVNNPNHSTLVHFSNQEWEPTKKALFTDTRTVEFKEAQEELYLLFIAMTRVKQSLHLQSPFLYASLFETFWDVQEDYYHYHESTNPFLKSIQKNMEIKQQLEKWKAEQGLN